MLTEVVIGLRHGCGIRRFERIRWATAEELHDDLHTGRSAVARRGGCNWVCHDLRQAAAIYDRLIEESKT
jgi:hypothetical protein